MLDDLEHPNLPCLRDVSIRIPSLDELQTPYFDIKEQTIEFEGVPLYLQVVQNIHPTENGLSFNIDLSTSSTDFKDAASCGLIINWDESEQAYVAKTNVDNPNRDFRGLGRDLWRFALGFIQAFSREYRLPTVHVIVKDPYTRQGFTPEKWDQIFVPLLQQNGYRPIDGVWKKIYSVA